MVVPEKKITKQNKTCLSIYLSIDLSNYLSISIYIYMNTWVLDFIGREKPIRIQRSGTSGTSRDVMMHTLGFKTLSSTQVCACVDNSLLGIPDM